MEDDDRDDTVVRPRALGPLDPAILDDDTVIRERAPFADIPREAFRRLSPARQEAPPPPQQAPHVPAVHRFRVNRHEPISLDAPALIGRLPSTPRITAGRPPRLVRVPSPLQEVSSTHLELRQQGSSVIVTDLRSTNGTVVRIPGSAAVKLRQGESVVVSVGTVVDIGDGNIVEILPIERVLPPS